MSRGINEANEKDARLIAEQVNLEVNENLTPKLFLKQLFLRLN